MALLKLIRACVKQHRICHQLSMKQRLGLLAIAVLAAACSDIGSPVGPIFSAPSHSIGAVSAVPGQAFAVQAVRWSGTHANAQYSTSGVIGSAGGSLSIPDADVTITFPAGALKQDVTITIVALSEASVAYDFLPHGLQFGKTVVVTQGLSKTAPGRGAAGSRLLYAAYLRDGREAISSQGQATAAEIISSRTHFDDTGLPVRSTWYLNHFSRYILASGVYAVVSDGDGLY